MNYLITKSINGTIIIMDTNSDKYFKGPTLDSWSFNKMDAVKLDEGRANKAIRLFTKLGIECKMYHVN